METIVLTTVYPHLNNKFFNEFLVSLEKQVYKDFTLVILNDGFGELDKIIKSKKINMEIINIKEKMSFGKIREIGIKYSLNKNAKWLIFADADDYFDEKRIMISIDNLKNGYDIVFNDINIVSNEGEIINKRYFKELRYRKVSFKDIIEKNYFGLSNTAVNVPILHKIKYIADKIKVVDWWIFTIVLYYTNKVKFIKNSLTYYRQHNYNFIGANNIEVDNYIKLGLEVKLIHYFNLYIFFKDIDKEVSNLFKIKFKEIEKVKTIIESSKQKFEIYKQFVINNRCNDKGWWAGITYTEL